MKKKIKDLTYEEAKKVCDKNKCFKCPLNFAQDLCFIDLLTTYEENMQQEIEVEDND